MAGMWQSASGETKQKKAHATGRFLQEQALGLIIRLTDVFNDTSNLGSVIEEQKRCIKAIEEMIRIGKTYIRLARPQVRRMLYPLLNET